VSSDFSAQPLELRLAESRQYPFMSRRNPTLYPSDIFLSAEITQAEGPPLSVRGEIL